jgi:deoxyribose-phosphate aldolase
MILTAKDIAQMLDLSCVKTFNNEKDINQLILSAKKYRCGHVSVLQCFIPYVKGELKDYPDIKLIGNVSFPSGSDSTTIKVAQTKELVQEGCDEFDMVINVGKLRSGRDMEVEKDVKAVISAANGPVKVIIEASYLTAKEIEKACKICINSGAAFVKTGTGWTPRGTTREDIKRIKAIVGDAIMIKASGGIRDLNTLVDMYKLGARRFGVNLKSGVEILEDCISRNGITVEI